jgi:hypothetical protein
VFKVLLVLGNVQGNIKVQFVKHHHLTVAATQPWNHHNNKELLHLLHIPECPGFKSEGTLSKCWKLGSTADCIVSTRQPTHKLKFTALNGCCKKLRPEAVQHFWEFPNQRDKVRTSSYSALMFHRDSQIWRRLISETS